MIGNNSRKKKRTKKIVFAFIFMYAHIGIFQTTQNKPTKKNEKKKTKRNINDSKFTGN